MNINFQHAHTSKVGINAVGTAPGRFFDGHIIDGHIIDGHIIDGHIIDQ